MENQPQNPEFRINPEKLLPMYCLNFCNFKKLFTDFLCVDDYRPSKQIFSHVGT